MIKAFWVWNPVCSGSLRRFDEPHAFRHNAWMFDKSVWQKMFRAMRGSGFDSFFLANSHPFPFMVRQRKFPEARMLSDQELFTYQEMYHWIFESAADYELKPYVLFFSIYYPDVFLQARGLTAEDTDQPSELALEYTRSCVEELVATYPELTGIVGDASENIRENRGEFIRKAIVEPVQSIRPETDLILRSWCGKVEEFKREITDQVRMPVRFSTKYTWEHLVSTIPDPTFTYWVDAFGGESVMAEFWISNFEPWTSFSYTTATGILENLAKMNCAGFSIHPLSIYEWPYTSDTGFKFQWQRDLVWYNVWGGSSVGELIEEQNPKWLTRAKKLVPGLEAASRILEILALYFGGDKQNQWHPQFSSVRDYRTGFARLLSVYDLAHLEDDRMFWGRNWWKEITGQEVAGISTVAKGEPDPRAFGPDELIESLRVLCDLAEEAVEAAERRVKGGGEKELPFLAMDARCMALLGRFWMARVQAAKALAKEDTGSAVTFMEEALSRYRELVETDKQHREEEFRVLVSRTAIIGSWDDILAALEAELEDAQKGEFKPGSSYTAQRIEPGETR